MESKRNTEQKRIIIDALKKADHPTAGELYDMIHTDNPRISRATVFRVLAQFTESGDAVSIGFPGSGTRYDAITEPHGHCHCVRCGKVVDVFSDKISRLLAQSNVEGFEVLSAELDFNGLCPECAGKKR